jgi:hypothetical protein
MIIRMKIIMVTWRYYTLGDYNVKGGAVLDLITPSKLEDDKL